MLGDLSKKYESNGEPGTISSGYGDAGGKSYGMYQLASNIGVVDEFISWLDNNGYWFASELGKHKVGSWPFDEAWEWLAYSDNRDDFAKAQHDFIRDQYYSWAVNALERNGYHMDNHSEVMKDVVWSRAVQYGVGNIVEMFTDAAMSIGYPNLSYVDAKNFDADMIKAIYLNVCKTPEWTNGSPSLRPGLYHRFDYECADALAMLERELGNG